MQVNPTTAVQPATATSTKSRQGTPTTAKAAVASTVQAAKTQQATSSAASVARQTYTTSVGGKNYSGNVQHANGQYTVSVPNLPGASASASSIQAAENALNVKIHILA